MLGSFLGNAPYLANLGLGGILPFVGRENGCVDFATQMQRAIAPSAWIAQCEVWGVMCGGVLGAAAPSADGLYEWLLVMGFLVGIGVGIKTLFFSKKVPQPLSVDLVKALATKEELEALEKDVDKRFDRVDEQLDSQRTTARVAISNVNKRIDAVVQNTSEMKGELKQMNANLERLIERHLK